MNVSLRLVGPFVLVALAFLCINSSLANPLAVGSYLWYAPEHERYGRTEFYSRQDIKSALVRVPRTQRFKILAAQYNWVLLEFDRAGKAFIPIRMLRYALYDPDAADPFYEFKRASIFTDEPDKVEARLKGPQQAAPAVTDSKTPSWKRYKDSWGLNHGRPTSSLPAAGVEDRPLAEPPQPVPRPIPGSSTAKTRNKYPLLPPLGSEPPSETAQPENPERDAESTPPP